MSEELGIKQDETKEEVKEEIKEEVKEESPKIDKVKELELENARLKGLVEGRSQSTPQPVQTVESEQDKYQKTKSTVLADAQSLTTEEFEERYKMSKAEAKLQFTNYELEQDRAKTLESMAILRAENQIAKKYGEKYSKYQEQIDSAIKDLAPSVRQNPQKLAEYIEIALRSYMYDDKEDKPTPTPKKKEGAEMNRKIVDSGFEKPNAVSDEIKTPSKKSDEIPDEYKPLATAFGLTSEKERQKFKEPQVDVAYGNNKWLTRNGVETIKP